MIDRTTIAILLREIVMIPTVNTAMIGRINPTGITRAAGIPTIGV